MVNDVKDPGSGRSPQAVDGPTGQLCSWLASLELGRVPTPVRERAKHLLLDGIGCALIGARLPWSTTAMEAVSAFEGSGPAIVVGWGRTSSAPAAALLNGTFIQGFELDDFHPFAPLHSASLVLPALLATCQLKRGVTGSTFLRGAIAGFEVGPRVGLALHGGEMISRGWHSGSVFGTHAAAAAAGSLLGLDAAAFEDALGLAGTQSAGLMAAQFEAMSKRMHHGMASRNGLLAAFLAHHGYTGIKQIFEQPYGGFLSTFGEGHNPDPSQITAELGARWETERIIVKPYAAMGGLHAALDALFEIGEKRPLRAEEISRIDVELSHIVYHHGWWRPERPLTPTGAQMNMGYVLAVAVLDGAALVRQFTPDRIARDDVWALIPRIHAHHNEEFDKAGARGRGQTRLRISFVDGTTMEVSRQAAKSVLEPLSNGEVVTKFRALTRGVVDASRQSRIEELVLTLEELPDVDALVEALAIPVKPAFELE